jgi:hypothetical protein
MSKYEELIQQLKVTLELRDKLKQERKQPLENIRNRIKEGKGIFSELKLNERHYMANSEALREYCLSLLPPTNATIREEYVKCKSFSCSQCGSGICAESDVSGPHGPYIYAYWKENKRVKKKYIGRSFEDYELSILVKTNKRYGLSHHYEKETKQQYKKRHVLEELAREGESEYPTLTETHRKSIAIALKNYEGHYWTIDKAFDKVIDMIMSRISWAKRVLENQDKCTKEVIEKANVYTNHYDDVINALFTTKNKWEHTQ